jgi:hypothetical protein
MDIPVRQFEDEAEMREFLAGLGFSAEKVELAIATKRNRPHPSQKKPHPMKGKKQHPKILGARANENPAPGGQRGVRRARPEGQGMGRPGLTCDYNKRAKNPFQLSYAFY